MAIQLSIPLRTSKANQLEILAGASPRLQIFTAAQPANCAAVDNGAMLANIVLPVDWLADGANGAVSKLGTWAGIGLAAAGAGVNASHFRIKDNAGTTTHLQGSISAAGGAGDMTLDNLSIAQNQNVSVNTFTLTEGNA